MDYGIVKSLDVRVSVGVWRRLNVGDRVSISINEWFLFQDELDEYSGQNNTEIINWLVSRIDLPYDEVHIFVQQDGNDRCIEVPIYIIDEIEIKKEEHGI